MQDPGGGANPIYADFFRSPPEIPKIGIGINRHKSAKIKICRKKSSSYLPKINYKLIHYI